MHPLLRAEDELVAWFERGGYFRLPIEARRASNGRAYHKGHEIRFIAASDVELNILRELLFLAEFTPARPFRKNKGWIQPVYGRAALMRFQQLCEFSLDISTGDAS